MSFTVMQGFKEPQVKSSACILAESDIITTSLDRNAASYQVIGLSATSTSEYLQHICVSVSTASQESHTLVKAD